MKMKRNTKPMNQHNIKRGEDARERVIAAIEQCQKDKKLSTTMVCKVAGVHRSYFTKHNDMREKLDSAIGALDKKSKKKKQSPESQDARIRALKAKIVILEDDSSRKIEEYKGKYENKCEEVKKLQAMLDKRLDEKLKEKDQMNF